MAKKQPLKLKCGCPLKNDESASVFGKKAEKDGDMAYCGKHGNVRLISRGEFERLKRR